MQIHDTAHAYLYMLIALLDVYARKSVRLMR